MLWSRGHDTQSSVDQTNDFTSAVGLYIYILLFQSLSQCRTDILYFIKNNTLVATTASIWSRYHTSCKKHISRVRNRPTGRHRPANDILQRPAGIVKSAETLQVTGLQVAPHRNGGVLLASIGTCRQNDCSRQNELPISQPPTPALWNHRPSFCFSLLRYLKAAEDDGAPLGGRLWRRPSGAPSSSAAAGAVALHYHH